MPGTAMDELEGRHNNVQTFIMLKSKLNAHEAADQARFDRLAEKVQEAIDRLATPTPMLRGTKTKLIGVGGVVLLLLVGDILYSVFGG